jgi:hypothetical protein
VSKANSTIVIFLLYCLIKILLRITGKTNHRPAGRVKLILAVLAGV